MPFDGVERRKLHRDGAINLPAFEEWLGTKPPKEEYDYFDSGACALAQYLRSTGREWAGFGNGVHHFAVLGDHYYVDCKEFEIPECLADNLSQAYTFGELADRLEAIGG